MKKQEKELYSKKYVTESINFIVYKVSNEIISMMNFKKFFCNLAIILARDKELVAVRLEVLLDGCKVYLFKNCLAWEGYWIYCQIQKYLKNISKNTPVKSKKDEKVLTNYIIRYYFVKIKTRIEKLKNEIIAGQKYDCIKFFIKFALIDINEIDKESKHKMFKLYFKYYNEVKEDFQNF